MAARIQFPAFSPIDRSRRASEGFTLIELLVVVTIIVVLLALLTPALDRAMNATDKTLCAMKLKSIGSATVLYAVQNNRKLPSKVVNNVADYGNPTIYQASPNFLGSLIPILGGGTRPFLCPTVRDVWPNQDPTLWSDTNYMGNAVVYGRPLAAGSGAFGPIVMIQELRYHGRFGFYRTYESAVGSGIYLAWQWHSGKTIPQGYTTTHDYSTEIPAGTSGPAGGNLLYLDQSVAFRQASTLRARDFGLTGGAGVTGAADDDNEVADNFSYRSFLSP